MTRFLVLTIATLSALGLFLALLLLGSWIAAGRPMPWYHAMLLSALIAPLFGWRFERLALQFLQASYRRGGLQVAVQSGPAMGYAVQSLARLSLGDVSLLIMALRNEGPDDIFLQTSPESPNHKAWATLEHLGLMGEVAAEPEVGKEPPIPLKRYYLTPKGKRVIPALLRTAATLRNSAPELV